MSSESMVPSRSVASLRPPHSTKASAPNLNAIYRKASSSAPSLAKASLRKASSSAPMTRSTLTVSDATRQLTSKSTGINTSPSLCAMPPSPPHDGDLNLGDVVEVPGRMHGIVKFIGSVDQKKGIFAGVELSKEFASRGKNSGDVDGISYFTTSVPGAGIFLPVNRAHRRTSFSVSRNECPPPTPTTPSISGGMKITGHTSTGHTPPTPGLHKIAQSRGNVGTQSPQGKKIGRPSLPRPESPLRKPQNSVRSSFGSSSGRLAVKSPSKSPMKSPAKNTTPAPRKFGQSVRGTQDSREVVRKIGLTPQPVRKGRLAARSTSAMEQGMRNESGGEESSVSKVKTAHHTSLGSLPPFTPKVRAASRSNSRANSRVDRYHDDADHLRAQLEDRDRRLQEQAITLAELENALLQAELSTNLVTYNKSNQDKVEDKDISQFRMMLQEKNEKISSLTAEFDAHRADFRSTIDTLESASAETERVYEQRIDDLLLENRELAVRTEDVGSVARQLRQLEELVQELEEGLEDARRGEAEARGEVEFLRGEVERTKSELKREREKGSRGESQGADDIDVAMWAKELQRQDDEIRGLKAIIHSLSRDAVSDTNDDLATNPTLHKRTDSSSSLPSDSRTETNILGEKLEEYNTYIETEFFTQKQHESEISSQQDTNTSTKSTAIIVGENLANPNVTEKAGSRHNQESRAKIRSARQLKIPTAISDGDAFATANENFCEICETAGHDILTCTKMFTLKGNQGGNRLRAWKDSIAPDDYKPAPLSPRKNSSMCLPPSGSLAASPVAGKDSGIINLDKWCGLCEREGHESIDCPNEDAF